MLMDAVFGPESFRNEIIWKRTSGHSDATRYGSVHDTILYYVRSDDAVWNVTFQEYDPDYVEQYYRYTDPNGRRWMSGDLGAAGLQGGGYDYVWKDVRRIWRVPPETMARLDAEGRVFYTKNGIPRVKRYLDEAKGLPIQDVWTDLEPCAHGIRNDSAIRHKSPNRSWSASPERVATRVTRSLTPSADAELPSL
jgi:adenine specific DNA methylase Mod